MTSSDKLKALVDRLETLATRAPARPWSAFDSGGNSARQTTLALMKGKCPPLKENGYPVRKWPEIITWGGFDGSDVSIPKRRVTLHLIVELANNLPTIIDALRSRTPPLNTGEAETSAGVLAWQTLNMCKGFIAVSRVRAQGRKEIIAAIDKALAALTSTRPNTGEKVEWLREALRKIDVTAENQGALFSSDRQCWEELQQIARAALQQEPKQHG